MIQQFSHVLGRGLKRFVEPRLPVQRQLAFSYQIARLNHCEPELTYLQRIGPNRGIAIDAGANEGLFTHRMSRLYQQVHAFEINPSLANHLQVIAPENVTVHAVGLSSLAETKVLHTPVSGGITLNGWASVESVDCPGADHYVDSQVAVRPLDSFDIHGVTFLKADVEGHEIQLLRGGRETIARDRPVVLVEVWECNRQVVREFFDQLGYYERRLQDLISKNGSDTNFIYLPQCV